MNSMLKPLSEFSAVAVAAVLNSLWLAVVVALIVRFVLRFAPRVNAATRHVIWWSVLAVVALMPLAARLRTPASPARSTR